MDPFDDLLRQIESADEEERRLAAASLAGFPFPQVKALFFKALADESWRVRKEVVDLILSLTPDDTLLRELASLLTLQGNAGLRNSAVEILQTVGERALPHLVAMLAHEDAGVRKFVVDIMGGIGSATALPELITMLDDPDANVAAAAAESLGAVGDAGAVSPLLKALERDELLIRYAILQALAKIGAPVPVSAITALAGDPLLKKVLFECLGVIGDSNSVPLLVDGLTERARNVREAALTALDMIRQRSSAAEFGAAAGARLREFAGTEAVEYIIAMGENPDLKLQRAAIILLGFIGDIRAVDALVKGCRDENLQNASLDAIRLFGAPAGPVLLHRFNRADEEQRCVIAYIAGEVAIPESSEIAAAALHDASPAVRAFAAEAVGKSGFADLIPSVVKLLNDDSPEVRRRATTALVHLTSVAWDSVFASAVHLSESDNPDCRLQSVKLFGALRELGHLIFLSKDEDYLVRRDAITALGELRIPDAAGRLAMALADEEADVRLAAVNALGWNGFHDETGALYLALGDPSQRVQAAAIKSLGRRKDALAFDRIVPFATSGSGVLKICAIQSLAQIDPHRAASVIAEAAADRDEDVARVAMNFLDSFAERF